MSTDTRIQTIPFATQDYVSVQHGDDRIDMYVSEPATGVTAQTGLMLLIHGWGNDGQAAYAEDSLVFADRSVSFYARLLSLSRPAQLFAVENGDHGLAGATRADEDSRMKATFLYAGNALLAARRTGVNPESAPAVRIPVRGGIYEVSWPEPGPVLGFSG